MGCCNGKNADQGEQIIGGFFVCVRVFIQLRNVDVEEFGTSILSTHNKLRAAHGSSPLQWSAKAASKAQAWARHLAQSGTLEHGNHVGLGQNLAYKMGADLSGEETANMWYQEISQYNFNQPGFKSGTGHFTQLVWAATTHLGAAKVTQGNTSYVVANYSPPGNITNTQLFEQNVKRKL